MEAGQEIDTAPGELTPYRRLDEILVEYAQILQDLLPNRFVGMYLSGSLALGDFDLTSDVDFIVVTDGELIEAEVNRVETAHLALIGREDRWVKHLEYSFFPQRQIAHGVVAVRSNRTQ